MPRHLFLITVAIGLLMPFLARLPSVPWRGWEWLTDYVAGGSGLLFFSAFNLVPALVLFGLGLASKRAPLAWWIATAAFVAFLLWAHGILNLRASSTAAIGLMFIPFYSIGAVIAGWGVGWLAHAVTKDDQSRVLLAGGAVVFAVVGSVTIGLSQTISTVNRENRFPVTGIKDIPLVSRNVFSCCAVGRVEVLVLDRFDSDDKDDIAVYGSSGMALLEPGSYAAGPTVPYRPEKCDGCLHMYPHPVPDGRGGFLVATSEGLSDGRGRLLWDSNASGFSETVPVRIPGGGFRFLALHRARRVDLHDTAGHILWSADVPVDEVVVYRSPDGRELPAAVVGYRDARRLQVYDLGGKAVKTVPLPEWALHVQSIDWPAPGHLLVGQGGWLSILDPQGREVLKHAIRDTSFDPYHGPDGAAVRFRAAEGPYLAVASHGSSGYPRSVLLIFDPAGSLVWQKEMNKFDSLLAVPRAGGMEDVLLVGGMDGVIEFSFGD